MQTKFIKTQNVKRFISLMDNLQKAPPNVPRIALVYGEFGLGKSQTIMWWVTNNDAIYVRCNHQMTSRWLLSEIVKELDEEPCRQSSHLFRQIKDKLKTESKVIVVDEIDYLFTNTHTIETLRDIHDKLGVPILLVGMGLSNRKLLKYGHIDDRIFAKLKFEKIGKDDYKEIISKLSEVEFTSYAIKYIESKNLQFRQIVKLINRAENLAATNKLNQIDEIMVKELFYEE